MKKVLVTIGVFSFITLLIGIFLFGESKGYEAAAKEYSWQIDTLTAVCSETPDTVRTSDTIISEKIVYIDKYTPISTSKGGLKEYSDTTRTKELDFWIHDIVRGEVVSRQTGYKLKVPLLIRDTAYIFKEVPKLVEVVKIKKENYKAFLQGSVGVQYYSVGYSLIIKERHAIGLNLIYSDLSPKAAISYTYFLKQ